MEYVSIKSITCIRTNLNGLGYEDDGILNRKYFASSRQGVVSVLQRPRPLRAIVQHIWQGKQLSPYSPTSIRSSGMYLAPAGRRTVAWSWGDSTCLQRSRSCSPKVSTGRAISPSSCGPSAHGIACQSTITHELFKPGKCFGREASHLRVEKGHR